MNWEEKYTKETGFEATDRDDCEMSSQYHEAYVEWLESRLSSAEKRIAKASKDGFRYGNIDGDHHKKWVIDQMLRSLLGRGYKRAVKDYENGPNTYEWEVGTPP